MAIKRHKRGNRVYLAEYKSIRQGKLWAIAQNLDFIDARVSRKKEGARIVWSYKTQELRLAESIYRWKVACPDN